MTGTRILYSRFSDYRPEAATQWLSAQELVVWNSLRSAARRSTWLNGRIVAKRLLLQLFAETGGASKVKASDIGIDTHSLRPGHGERPAVTVAGVTAPVALSIAHTDRAALAAAVLNAEITIGVDLVERASNAKSLRWAFSPAEHSWLAASSCDAEAEAQLWALKEALYKACQQGEGFVPRDIEVVPGLSPLYPRFESANLICLQRWRVDGHVAALAIAKRCVPESLTAACPRTLVRAA